VGPLRWHWVLAVLVAAAPVRANPIEVFGFTSRRAGQANVGVAAADDASALYYDPAGLVASRGGELIIGSLAAYSHLGINTDVAKLSDKYGFQLAVRAPLPLGGALADRFAIGIALHLLPRNVARIIAPAPDQAFYPYYGDRLSRVVVLPGAAMRLGGGLSLGVAVNVLASLNGSIYAAEGATREIDARVDERVPTIARLIAGAQWQASPALRFGLVYRQRFEIPFSTSARTVVAGEPIDLDLRASGLFTPHQIAGGVHWATDGFAAALDIGWANWSGYPGPYVQVDSRLPLIGPVPGQTPRVPFKDTFSVRAGLESLTDEGLVYRGGYGFESSAIPAKQTGVTNLLDGTKHTVAFGAGYVWKRLRIDAHMQATLVSTRTLQKTAYDGMLPYDPYTSIRDENPMASGTQSTNPGYPSIKSGGEIISAGITLEVPL
jgi:long-chain fatty acid transport protein